MTDREMVMHLCERLGLVETSFNLIGCHSNGYCMDDKTIVLGSGNGYSGFVASFVFDSTGTIISHSIEE